jgi:hypothetical protein
MTLTKTVPANIFFHFVFLGLIVRPLFYPDMPHEYWLVLFVMFALMNPIIAYFFGWDMNLGAGSVYSNASQSQRLSLLLLLMAVYIFVFLKWLGIIGQVVASS